jgi:hypothetical protein
VSSLFVLDGDTVVPTDLARGPWVPDALHGGPTSALLARAIESCPSDGVDVEVARLTIELLRPVPVAPLAVGAEVVRKGRKIQLVEATVRDAGRGIEVARARALRIRRAPVDLPLEDPLLAPEPPPEPGPEDSRLERSSLSDSASGDPARDYVAFHNAGSEHRFAAGSWAEPGPVTVWIRLLAPVVEGEEPTPLQRTAAAADYGNGVSRVLSWETHTFINPELSVHLLRPAAGPWICLEARTALSGVGVGLAESVLYDVRGRIGRAAQSLIVEDRLPG